ncbi:Hypothetical predicted protein [Cloeon dipterum]|uniref:RING-type domain-containing protein n=1 Tax=Cloeon dipterum TaxID=197152 RepID=A0A8S1CPH2_9INSE|nr:Hypothetical predicted protein [Cloeon dipterum]
MTDSSVGISQAKASASMPKGFASIDWADNEECPVCKKPLGSRDVGVPNCCNHFFCFTCIKSWVTKSKSNCPMDRLDITELRVFDTRGKFLRSVKVEAKDEEPEVDFTFEDDGICPDCGWMGMRATVGVCMHCMYHVEDPVPATNCPQCMENESDPSDEEWVPESARVSSLESRRSRTLRSDTNQHVLLDDEVASFSSNRRRARNSINLEEFIVENDSDDSIEFGLSFGGRSSSASNLTEDLAQPGPSTSQAPPRTIRRKVVRKTTAKKRKTTTKKRKVRRKKVVRKKTSTTGGNRRKRKVKRRRTVKRKKKTPSNRPRLPEDSAKKRLAKILGVKAPKYSGQMLPRGCKKQAVTAAQRQALASTSSSSVYNRPVESLDYHNSSVPTLHLFGGPELEYFPSDSDSEGSSSDYDYARKPLPSTSASVIKRYKNNALKSLRKKTVAASVSVSSSAPVNILDSIFESQNKKFEIKSGIDKRLDPYNVTPTSSVISGNSRKVKFNSSDEASSSNNTSRSSSSTYKNFKNSIEDSGRAVNFLNCKKSPSKDDDLDLYGDIPAEGTGNAGADDDDVGDAEDYLFDGGDAGSNTGGDGDGGGGDGDDDDKDKKDVEQPNEEEQEKEDDEEDDDDETEDISEMVIDESVLADDYEVKDDVEDETKDPLAIAEEVPLAAPSPEIDEKVILPDNLPDPVFPIISPIVVASHMLAPPVFRYSETSLQIARHLNLDDENVPTEQEEPEEHPEEPESEPEDSPAQCDESKEQFTAFPYPQMSPPRDQNVVKNERFSPPRSLPLSSIKKEEEVASPVLEPPKIITNGIDSGGTKKIARSKSRKRSLVEELFGSDIDDNVPPRKVSTDKGSEDGEIRDKKRKSDEETKIQTKKENEVEPEPSAKMSPKRSKRKKEKSRELSNKKKKKERKRSRSRSSSPDRKKKHHSKKHSPSRHSRKRSRSRSRSRKRHEENGRLSVHERLGPKRGRSRDRSSEPSGKKEVFSSGENILVSVNFSRRRKRIAEIAAKRRPVAVINLAVDEDKSPIIEKGDSPKEVIELDEGWSTDDEPVKAKQKETTSKMKEKSLKIKETGPKTPPEPQVIFILFTTKCWGLNH